MAAGIETLAELARRSNIEPSTISQLEKGQTGPNTPWWVLYRIAKVVNVRVEDLMGQPRLYPVQGDEDALPPLGWNEPAPATREALMERLLAAIDAINAGSPEGLITWGHSEDAELAIQVRYRYAGNDWSVYTADRP